jgi:hypothetical protein
MTLRDIVNIRLTTQQIAATEFKTTNDIVSWMGVMQAQDYAMAKWAIGTRLPKSTEQSIETALDKGEIIRTHLLRPTWHFVSSADIYWMLELTAARIKILMRSNNNQLELTDIVFKKTNKLLEKALTGGKHLTRAELIPNFQKNKIATNENRLSHILLWAESDGIICSGARKDNKQTYVLLTDRVPEKITLPKEESLAKLAKKYFSSHCPATLQDFVWWSGLSISDAKDAIEMIKSDLIAEKVGAETYWLTDSLSTFKKVNPSVYLLPAYDEFLISYKDRTAAAIAQEKQMKIFTNNGIFRPIIVTNGLVTGSWKRIFQKDKIIIETEFFKPPAESTKRFIKKHAEKFGRFSGKKIEISPANSTTLS